MNLQEATAVAAKLARREPATHTCRGCTAPCHAVDEAGLCTSCQPEACDCCGRLFASEELTRGECKGCQRDRYDDEPEYEVEDCDDDDA